MLPLLCDVEPDKKEKETPACKEENEACGGSDGFCCEDGDDKLVCHEKRCRALPLILRETSSSTLWGCLPPETKCRWAGKACCDYTYR